MWRSGLRATRAWIALMVLAAGCVSAVPAGPTRQADAERRLRAHMDLLAGDALAGRRGGSREEWIAAEYVGSQLRQWGLEPVTGASTFVQPVFAPQADAPTDDASVAEPATWNTFGQIAGRHRSRASEVVLLTAHLDHLGSGGEGADAIFNGADDNASGVAAVLEVARRLAVSRPSRTVMFAFFGGEERGGIGSRAFIDEPPVPLDRIVVNLNVEMIGRPDPAVAQGTIWMTGHDRSNLGATLERRGWALVADPRPDQQFFYRSDNIRLARRGVVAHTLSTFGLHQDYHTVDDEVDRIDFTHMARVVDVLAGVAAWLSRTSFTPAWREGGQP